QTLTLHEALEKSRADASGDPGVLEAFRRLETAHGTPLYVYDQATLERQARSLKAAFARFPKLRLFYAVKANSNLEVVRFLHREGFGAEVVSEGEIVTAERAGVAGKDVMFTSSSKGPSEIEKALRVGAVLNVDSRDELEQVEAAAKRLQKTARISFRINPGV